MKELSKPDWWYIDKDTAKVEGHHVPAYNKLPYWSNIILTTTEADTIYHSVISQYTSKQLHRVYTNDGRGSQINLDTRYTHAYEFNKIEMSAEIERRLNLEVELCASTWWNSEAVPVYSPQILGYEEKCKFLSHCDNSILTAEGWVKNDLMRDVTALLYISDYVKHVTQVNQHSGGELVLDNIGTRAGPARVYPKKGQVLIFPSHQAYIHQVPIVTRGYRVAVVNWWTLKSKK